MDFQSSRSRPLARPCQQLVLDFRRHLATALVLTRNVHTQEGGILVTQQTRYTWVRATRLPLCVLLPAMQCKVNVIRDTLAATILSVIWDGEAVAVLIVLSASSRMSLRNMTSLQSVSLGQTALIAMPGNILTATTRIQRLLLLHPASRRRQPPERQRVKHRDGGVVWMKALQMILPLPRQQPQLLR